MRGFLIVLGLALAYPAGASEASKLYAQGRKAEKAGQMARAYLLYSEAAALEPANHQYWSRSLALQTRAALEGKVTPALSAAELEPAAAPEPEPEPEPLEAATLEDIAESRKPLPPTELKAAPGRQDFNLKSDAKLLFQTVAKAFGLDCVFDGDYRGSAPIHFQMDQADYREALHGLEAVTASFIVPISDKLFMVVKDTTQKRREEEPYAAVVVPLSEPTSQQELTSMVTAVQQACGIQKVAWDSHRNTVILRDTVSKVLAARELFQQLLHPRAEVYFEMNFIEVSRSQSLNFGLPLTSSFPVYSFSKFMNNVPQLARNISGVLKFGFTGMIGIGIANMQLVTSLTKSDASNLLHATARSVDGQPATIHVGQRYPVLTAGYFGPASFSGPNAYTPPPSFTFEDLGLSIKATPHVHSPEDLTLSLEAEFKVLAGQASNGIPIISNRSLKSDLRLKMGEWAVVAGLVSNSDARTLAGIAGLNRIPILGPLTSSNTRENSDDQVLILLRPTLIIAPPDESMTHVLHIGSETRPLTQM